MKTKFKLFRRNGVFYTEDTSTGKQTSLRTKDETEAKSLLNAKNKAQRQGVRPQRGASWRLDSRPAAHVISLPNVFLSSNHARRKFLSLL